MSTGLDISIVIPVYNSQPMLRELVERIDKTLAGENYHLFMVDDGSKDESWDTLVEVKKSFPEKLTLIRLAKNFGQHNALVCGFNYAKGDVVITMDDDLQHPPEELPKLLAKYQETHADLVYGTFLNRIHQDIVRSTGSYIFKKSARINSKQEQGSSFRLIAGEITQKIAENHRQNFYFIDEIIQWYTANISTVPIENQPRKIGKSGYSKFKLFSLYFNIVINYSAVPLKLMTYGGIVGSLITFMIGSWFVIKKIFFATPVPGFTALIVAIMFSTSIMLLCFGIIGQYLYQIFQTQNRKPPYSVSKIA